MWLDVSALSMDEIKRSAEVASDAGAATLWLGEVGNWDPLTLLTVLGHEPEVPRLGTAIVRTYPRHPLALAAQALTIQVATGNGLVLGLGPSHAPVIEGQYGMSFAAPARNMRDYLGALMPLLRGESVAYEGAYWTAAGQLDLPGAMPPPVLVAALGPRMLGVAGELADGVITTWAGAGTVAEYVIPTLHKAAGDAGRDDVLEVVAQVPVCVTSDPDGVRRLVDDQLAMARDLPSYRAIFEREGVAGPGGTIIAGDEERVARDIRRYADAGATEFLVTPVGPAEDVERTISTLAHLR
jgi:F420-dependent oxidoreductase-like protein